MSAAAPRTWTVETVKSRCDIVGECWLWKGAVTSTGYPQATINGQGGQAVRTYLYDVILGKNRSNKTVIAAKCEDRRCCAPVHLVPRTRSTVIARQHAKGMRSVISQFGEGHPFAKLTRVQVNELRSAVAAVDVEAKAREFGVTRRAIANVIKGRSWRITPAASVFTYRP